MTLIATGQTWTLTDEGARPLTVNAVARLHRQQWAAQTKATRERWFWLAKEAKVPELRACVVEATPLHRDGRSPQDVAACSPAVKAGIDGLRDAGVLPDDTAEYVREVRFLPPEVCGIDGLRLRIVELAL